MPNTPCSWCGQPLTREEIEEPDRDENGAGVCSECYYDEHYDICTRCGDSCHEKELASEPGSLIWVGETAGLSGPGYYRVIRWPFYADGMTEGYFFDDALMFVGPLDEKGERVADRSSAAAGPMCAACRTEIELSVITGALRAWPSFGMAAHA